MTMVAQLVQQVPQGSPVPMGMRENQVSMATQANQAVQVVMVKEDLEDSKETVGRQAGQAEQALMAAEDAMEREALVKEANRAKTVWLVDAAKRACVANPVRTDTSVQQANEDPRVLMATRAMMAIQESPVSPAESETMLLTVLVQIGWTSLLLPPSVVRKPITTPT